MRNESKKIIAEVLEYRKEKGPMRNDYTELEYPYVKIDSDNKDEYSIRKLRYADNYKRAFYIGQKINVFWYNNDLLYWETYDNGIYKFIPNKWSFIKKKP